MKTKAEVGVLCLNSSTEGSGAGQVAVHCSSHCSDIAETVSFVHT